MKKILIGTVLVATALLVGCAKKDQQTAMPSANADHYQTGDSSKLGGKLGK